MKKHYLIIFILILSLKLNAQIQVLDWSDEFSYTGLPNNLKWGYDVGGGGWGNNELQYYTENRLENARVENGKLVIEARKESYGGSSYTSARLVTKQKGDWLYGRIEAYAKLPSGRGTWPAIWMLPTDWVYGGWPNSGEIDIMEYVGYDPGVVHGSIHTEVYNHILGTQKTATINVADAETAYHLYALEWTSDRIDIFVDGNKYFSFFNQHIDYKTWPFDRRFHLLLNIAVGGNWGGAMGVDPDIWPQKMYVDYVRVYKYISKDEIKVEGTSFALPNQENLSFKVQNIVGATYLWTVPEGASITSGQGTSEIQVRWGTIAGDVACNITHPDANGLYTRNVAMVINPSGDKYSIIDFKYDALDGWTNLAANSNIINLIKEDSLLKIKYDIKNPNSMPYIEYTFPSPVSMAELTVMNIFMKTFNLSNSVIVRADLFDINNRYKDAVPVFKFTPADQSGLIRSYYYDFNGNWGSYTPDYGSQLDNTKIKGIRFYLNYGLYGKIAKDSLWFNKIVISKVPILTSSGNIRFQKRNSLNIYPNPTNGILFVDLNPIININDQISVYDITGRHILSQRILENPVQINCTGFQRGIYIIKCELSDSVQSSIFVIQ